MKTPTMNTNASITPPQCQALVDMFGALHLVTTGMTRLPTTLRLEAEPYVNAVQGLEEAFTGVLKEGQIWLVTNPEWFGDKPATVGHLSLQHCGVLYQVLGDLRLIVESIADLPSLLVDEFDQFARTLDLVAGSLECFITDIEISRSACDSVELNLPGVKHTLHYRPQHSVIEDTFSNFGREPLHATPAGAPNATEEAERAARAKALGVPWRHRSRPSAIVIPARHYQKLARAASCLALLETTDNSANGLKVKADLMAVAREAVEQAMVAARVWTRA